jgi:alanine dehydrogenase
MLILNEAQTRKALPFPALIEALAAMFRHGGQAPSRHHHSIEVPGEPDATLLLMPAWLAGRYYGVKMLSVFPGNTIRGLPSIYGSYLLSSGTTGELLAVIDGGELTARRTAAASALASSYLSRPESSHMLMMGTGRLSANVIEAHRAVRPLRSVSIWGRDPAKAEAIAAEIAPLNLTINIVSDIEEAARTADIISCATLSDAPLIKGVWLKPGAHLDLIGAFKPSMRESDNEAVTRSRVFVDTRAGALGEAGDLIQPIRDGVFAADAIQGELSELCGGSVAGRNTPEEITLFKSVGASIEDLAGAILAIEQIERKAADEL